MYQGKGLSAAPTFTSDPSEFEVPTKLFNPAHLPSALMSCEKALLVDVSV
jgi:hypothetical protein